MSDTTTTPCTCGCGERTEAPETAEDTTCRCDCCSPAST
jgi:hypothetical protein